jgi:hypothetical protein
MAKGKRTAGPASESPRGNGTKSEPEPRRRILRPSKRAQEALTYAERKPLLLQLLERLETDGPAGFARTFDDRHLRGLGPRRLTNRERARYLLAELESDEYMARKYEQEADGIAADARRRREGGHPDFDIPEHPPDHLSEWALRERRARDSRRLSAASEYRSLRTVYRATGKNPTATDVERSLRHWGEHYAEKARRLREELGPSFLNGSWEKREALVRKWRHRYRKAGLLSEHQEPSRESA